MKNITKLALAGLTIPAFTIAYYYLKNSKEIKEETLSFLSDIDSYTEYAIVDGQTEEFKFFKKDDTWFKSLNKSKIYFPLSKKERKELALHLYDAIDVATKRPVEYKKGFGVIKLRNDKTAYFIPASMLLYLNPDLE